MILNVYSREGCPLCEEAIAELNGLKADLDLDIQVIDIHSDDGLLERYQLMIPVAELDGKIIGYGRIRKELIRKRLLEKKQETIVE
ncbi:glutaredoxin family protein [Metabacillus indicus]|uniref:glutaredoxin family protein n=1 Tax=Metabacillus indicus TaxID=246786 RepID=UPI0004933640|nr:glutaredoxin family protein [Metabacillus indicus]KEZ48684.1 glutaredoxin [Metabacillus indicus LMG 22858]